MSGAMAREVEHRGWTALYLENAHSSLLVLPELGAKIVSLRCAESGTEYLWQDPTRPYQRPDYGDAFESYDSSGFDECFPTIGTCSYPGGPWDGITAPDHGELWSLPWRWELQHGRTLYLHAYGVRFPYHFERWIELADDAARFNLRYRITNLSPFPFSSLWSAHPLFAAVEGMQVLLPGAPRMRLAHAIGGRIGSPVLHAARWPWLAGPSGEPLDYSQVGARELNANDKVFVDTPREGWCALYRPQTGDYVGFTIPPERVPFVGVCINHGGWPFTGVRGFWVALEPCTGWPDRLDQATASGAHTTLDGFQAADWSVGLHVGRCATAGEVGRALGRVPRHT